MKIECMFAQIKRSNSWGKNTMMENNTSKISVCLRVFLDLLFLYIVNQSVHLKDNLSTIINMKIFLYFYFGFLLFSIEMLSLLSDRDLKAVVNILKFA